MHFLKKQTSVQLLQLVEHAPNACCVLNAGCCIIRKICAQLFVLWYNNIRCCYRPGSIRAQAKTGGKRISSMQQQHAEPHQTERNVQVCCRGLLATRSYVQLLYISIISSSVELLRRAASVVAYRLQGAMLNNSTPLYAYNFFAHWPATQLLPWRRAANTITVRVTYLFQ